MSRTLRSLVCAIALAGACGDDSGDSGAGANAGSGGARIIQVSDSGTSHGGSGAPAKDAGAAVLDAARPQDSGPTTPASPDDAGVDSDGGEVDLHVVREHVQRNCKETQACSMTEGSVEECVSTTLGFLVGAPREIQLKFEGLSVACRDLVACDYVQCANDFTAGGTPAP